MDLIVVSICYFGLVRNDNGWAWRTLIRRKHLMQRHPDVVRRMGIGRLPWSEVT